MENKGNKIEKTDRELALEWWNNNLFYSQRQAYNNAINGDYLDWLTGDQIEILWKEKIDSKPNQKQYKKFEPELFRAYVEKFSDEDKRKACRILNSIVANI